MRLRHAIPFTLIAGIAAAACGAAALAPEMAVSKAAGQLGDDRVAAYTLSLHGDEAALAAFDGGDADDAEMRSALLSSQLTLTRQDDAFGLDVEVDGIEHAAEARFVDGTLYARADVPHLVKHFGVTAADADRFADEAAAMGIDFVDAAIGGAWLALDLSPVVSAAEGTAGQHPDGFGAVPGLGLPDLSDVGPDTFADLVDALGKAYAEDVRVDQGELDGPGDHYVVSASARKIVEHLLPAIAELPLLGGIPGGELPSAADIPDERYRLDLWIKDGNISRAEFDLSQVAPADGTPRLALRVDIDRNPEAVATPDRATKVDLAGLIGTLLSGIASGQ